MNIRTKIMLSIAVGAVFTALAAIEIGLLGTKSVGAVVSVMFVFCAAAGVVGLFISDSVDKPLNKVSRDLAKISEFALRNADNSTWARLLAAESNAAVSEGESAVERMAEVVNLIKSSSDNNAKIIKAVNYMALRANFLSFNAAIAAAHAGESSKAFACVADEVRNFAIRCAWTAQNTADMIKESARDVEIGVKTVGEVANSIRKIVDRADNVDDMVGEIARISDEQAKSIRCVNEAVARINPVVGQSVGTAAVKFEEPAGAVEKADALMLEHAGTADGFVVSVDGEPDIAVCGRRSLPARQRVYASFPYQRMFSATALAFWTPMRTADMEEAVTIDDCEMWR